MIQKAFQVMNLLGKPFHFLYTTLYFTTKHSLRMVPKLLWKRKLHVNRSFHLVVEFFNVCCFRQNIENLVPVDTPEQESVLFPGDTDNLTCGEYSTCNVQFGIGNKLIKVIIICQCNSVKKFHQ